MGFGGRNLSITMSRTLHDVAARVRTRLKPTVERTLEDEVSELHDHARQGWPVKTGLSRRSLEHGSRPVGSSSALAYLRNRAPYALSIYTPAGQRVWDVLVLAPAAARARRVADRLRDDLVDVVRGRR